MKNKTMFHLMISWKDNLLEIAKILLKTYSHHNSWKMHLIISELHFEIDLVSMEYKVTNYQQGKLILKSNNTP